LLSFLLNYTDSLDTLDWHTSTRLRDAANQFHDKHARQPDKIKDAKRMHTRIIDELNWLLRRKNICIHLEYAGSSYEGVKVSKNSEDDDLEFDVMVIIKGGDQLVAEAIPKHPGYALLKIKSEYHKETTFKDTCSQLFGVFDKGLANPEKTAEKFLGELQKCINGSEYLKNIVRLRKHGPSVQMDIHPNGDDKSWDPKYYSVDMTPTYRICNGYYVAKPLRVDTDVRLDAWRVSYSLEV
jgi:hypothetical protein